MKSPHNALCDVGVFFLYAGDLHHLSNALNDAAAELHCVYFFLNRPILTDIAPPPPAN